MMRDTHDWILSCYVRSKVQDKCCIITIWSLSIFLWAELMYVALVLQINYTTKVKALWNPFGVHGSAQLSCFFNFEIALLWVRCLPRPMSSTWREFLRYIVIRFLSLLLLCGKDSVRGKFKRNILPVFSSKFVMRHRLE